MYLQNKYTKCYYSIVERAKSRDLPKEIYIEKHHVIPKSLGGANDQSNLVRLTAREHFVCHRLLAKMVTGANKRSMTFALWSMMNRDHSKQRSRHQVNSHTYEFLKKQVALASSHLHKGKAVSKETREKISKSQKGKTGYRHSEETKQKISQANKGKKKSAESIAKQVKNRKPYSPSLDSIAKMLASRKHYKHSEETKQKISQSNKGKKQVISAETKKKISDSLKGRIPYWLKGKPGHSLGKTQSEETKNKLRVPKPKFTCPHCYAVVGGQANYNRWHGKNCKAFT